MIIAIVVIAFLVVSCENAEQDNANDRQQNQEQPEDLGIDDVFEDEEEVVPPTIPT